MPGPSTGRSLAAQGNGHWGPGACWAAVHPCPCALHQAIGWENMAFVFLNRFLDLCDVSGFGVGGGAMLAGEVLLTLPRGWGE